MLDMMPTSTCGGDPSHVRFAGLHDEEDLVAMLHAMHSDDDWLLRDAKGERLSFNAEKARARIQMATQRQRNHPNAGQAWIGVVGDPGKLQGSVFVSVVEPWLEDGAYLTETWSYIIPDCRRGNVGAALLEFCMALADELELSFLNATMSRNVGAKFRLYERRLGQPIGSLFRYSPQITG